MPRKPMIAANWKMNIAPQGWGDADSPFRPQSGIDVVVLPTALDLPHCIEAGLETGPQFARPEAKGAFTGDISMAMAKDLGCTWVLCGHSERRKYHAESDAFVGEQVKAALATGLKPIMCIGETAEERERGQEKIVIERQLQSILQESKKLSEAVGLAGPAAGGSHSGKGELVRGKPLGLPLTLAYEPVWAIGTGKNATAAQAQEMHAFIRSLVPKEYQQTMRILYGGSMNAANAEEILAQTDVDGGLIGGASLKPDEFGKILEAAKKK